MTNIGGSIKHVHALFDSQFMSRFLVKLLGNEDEINLLGDGTEKAEFGHWSWMTPEEVVEHISFPVLTLLILK